MKTREQKQQERTARLAQLECDRAAFAARMEAARLSAGDKPYEWTCADQLEAQRLLIVGAPRHPDNLNCFVGVPGCSLRGEAK